MKMFKTKNVFFNILLAMLCLCTIVLFTAPSQIGNRVLSYAGCTKVGPVENEDGRDMAIKPMYTDADYGGNVPFSLFLSYSNGTKRDITDYYPTFDITLPKEKEDSYYQIMRNDSAPVFLLCSDDSTPETQKLYDSTVFFKFNDQDFKERGNSTIPVESGFLSVTGTVNDTVIITELIDTSNDGNATTQEASYVFSVNLQQFRANSDNSTVRCPEVSTNNSNTDTSTSGGSSGSGSTSGPAIGDGENNKGQNGRYYLGDDENGNNDVSFRTGRYNFHIEYSYRQNQNVSNVCYFDITFYIIDYSDYIIDQKDGSAGSPFNIYNTDTVYAKTTNLDANYEVYNYNYAECPILEYDASKFGTNFVFTAGYSNYYMRYKSFQYNKLDGALTLDPTTIQTIFESAESGNEINKNYAKQIRNREVETGTITLELRNNPNVTYEINTYYMPDENNKYYGQNYIAQLNFKDFEKFVTTETDDKGKKIFASATTMQGTYQFDLEFLIENGKNGFTEAGNNSYITLDKTLFEYIPAKITQQKLVIFGYELKYYDQDPSSKTYHQDVTLVKQNAAEGQKTHTNFIAYNSLTSARSEGSSTGFLVDIPDYIAITDQAPLRFHSFGNLYGEGVSYVSNYAFFDYLAIDEDDVLGFFKNPLKNNTNSDIGGMDYVNIVNSTTVNGNPAISYDRTYNQGAIISGDGIRIMKLEYNLTLNLVSGDDESIIEIYTLTGCQYVVFEINNTVQNLYIQSVDSKKQEVYDFDTYTNKNVRVNLEQKPNTFYAPVNVDFQYSGVYNRDNLSTATRINLKDNGATTQVIDGKKYGYYISSQTESGGDYTFRNSGYYRITIRSVLSNAPKYYSFIIDKDPFDEIKINDIQLSEESINGKTTYLKRSSVLQDVQLITDNENDVLKYDLYIAKDGFTLSWKEKTSRAKSYSYVYYMEITDDTQYNATSLFEIAEDEEYWITNGLKTKTLSSGISTYKNSYDVKAPSMNTVLEYNQYFNKEGLYFFYVYDNAGNYFTRIILVDNSQTSTLQGYWAEVTNEDGVTEEVWENTFDPVDNPANYVNHDTTIYFGTHKAIYMLNPTGVDVNNKNQYQTWLHDANMDISIEDISFTRAYDISKDGGGKQKLVDLTIDIDFYQEVLNKLTNYVRTTNKTALISDVKDVLSPAGTYLTLANTVVKYQVIPTWVDLETEEVVERDPALVRQDIARNYQLNKEDMFEANIYIKDDPSVYKFEGEAEYIFKVTNMNSAITSKYVCMNFDVVQGTFYGYGNEEGETTEHTLRKNGATNLKNIKFEYLKISDETADYYTLKRLVYDYYEFVLDDSNVDENDTYPFASDATPYVQVNILKDQKLSADGKKWIIDPINIDSTEFSRPGKYVVTREYVGGPWQKVSSKDDPSAIYTEDNEGNIYKWVESGGDYYESPTTEGLFIPLFELDTLIRKYIVYVDHNGIITSTYMVRTDGKQNVREVGDKITISLSANYDDERTFTEFFLTSTATLSLDTNKIPVKINIPFSKYFANRNLYAKQPFAQLEVKVRFRLSKYSEWLTYVIDGYNPQTGFCTTSDPRVNSDLIFTSAGEYEIIINDNTGYLDITSNSENNTNMFPTTFTYRFSISHTAPYGEAYTNTYSSKYDRFETNRLYDYDTPNNFATNIKKVNETLPEGDQNNNKALVIWNDAITPYTARINLITISIADPTTTLRQNLTINLKNYDLWDIATRNLSLTFANSDYYKYILHFKVTFFEGISEPTIYDNEPYYRYTYEMSLDITEEYVYNISFYYLTDLTNNPYIGANNVNFGQSDYKLSIDRTKPFTNIDALLAQEEFLYSSGYYTTATINNFKEENFDPFKLETSPSAFSYTFGIDNKFTLSYNKEDTLPYFFVRNFNQYENQYISITPDMVDTVYTTEKAYFNRTVTDSENGYYGFGNHYPRFEEVVVNNEVNLGSYRWYKIDYDKENKTTLYSLIRSATGSTPSGYYEVIERDLAGNYRSYAVYFTEYGSNEKFLTLNIKGYHQQGYSEVEYAKDSAITASLMFEMTELSSKLGWGKVTIKNETSDIAYSETIFLSPFDGSIAIRNRLENLNKFFETKYNSTYSITLSKYNSAFSTTVRSVIIITNESAKLAAPTVEEVYSATNTTYNLVFTEQIYSIKSVLFLERLELYIMRGTSTWAILGQHTYEGKDNIPQKITGLTKGIYKVIYQDNYNKAKSYSYIIYVGEYYINNFNREYTTEFGTFVQDPATNVYYSGGDITVTYEGNIYNVWVNGVQYSNSDRETLSPTLSNYNCKTFTLTTNYEYTNIPADETVGGSTYYTIVYRDVTDNSIQKTYNFTIFNKLPEVSLKNNDGETITSTLEESETQFTSSVVNITWGSLTEDDCEFEDLIDTDVITARLLSRDDNGEYTNNVSISKGQSINEEGFYKIEIIHSVLGNYREVYFAISYSDLPLYTVSVGKEQLHPSTAESFSLINSTNNELNRLIDVIYNNLSKVLNDVGTGNRDFLQDLALLKNELGFRNGTFNKNTVGTCSLEEIPHYYSIETPTITYNSSMKLKTVEFVFTNDKFTKAFLKDYDENPTPKNVETDYWTTIYLIYNLDGPIRIEFFAVTKVPITNSLLKHDISFTDEENINRPVQQIISLNTYRSNYQIYYPQIRNGAVQLSWNKLSTSTSTWYNVGNIVRIFDTYGVSTEAYELDFEDANINTDYDCLTSRLEGSGSHKVRFQDLAGNVQKFNSVGSYQQIDYYTLDLIDSVIYYITYNNKDYNPIQYGVFNDELTLAIDQQYVHHYLNARANISVTRNGTPYSDYENDNNMLYKFTSSGRYVVELSGSYAGSARAMKTTTFTFTIIDSNSARLAYEFVGVTGYEILQVTRNGEDITNNFRNADGKVLSLFINSTSELSGNGNYSITLKYGKTSSEILSYHFTINNYIPTISSNVEHGESTTGSIQISFNPSLIYEQLGECYVKILTYNNDSKTFYLYGRVTIDENSFVDASAKTIEITRSNSYYIQVETKSGNVISSFRVNRKDPLNAFAIIVIVVSVVVVIAIIIIIVKLRTKMKIK